MRRETRTGLSTVISLTFYVGVLPFVAIAAIMFFARAHVPLEDWGLIFAVLYLAFLFVGARAYAISCEPKLPSSRLPKA